MALNSPPPRSDELTTMNPAQYPPQKQAPLTIATPTHSNGLNGDPPLAPQSTEGAPTTRIDQPTTTALDILRGVRGQLSLAFYSLRIRYPSDHPALRLLGALQQDYITTVNNIHRQLQATDPPQTAPPHPTTPSAPAFPSHPPSSSPTGKQQQQPQPTKKHSISSVPQLIPQQPPQKLHSNEAQYIKDSIAKNRTKVLSVCQSITKDGDRVKRYITHLGERLQVAEKSYQALGVDIREARMEVILMKKAVGLYENPTKQYLKGLQPPVGSAPDPNHPVLEQSCLLYDGTKVGTPSITKAKYYVPPPDSPPLPSPCSSSSSSEPTNPYDLEIFDDAPRTGNHLNEASDDTFDYSTDESPSSSPSQTHTILNPDETNSGVIVRSRYSSLEQALVEYPTSPPPLASHSRARKRKTTGDNLASTSAVGGTQGPEVTNGKGKGRAREWALDEGFVNIMAETSGWLDERPKKKFKGGP